MTSLPNLFHYVQQTLFPKLSETCDDPLTLKHRELIWVFSSLRVEEFVDGPWRWHVVGVLPHDRRKIARAFIVKAWLRLAQTKDLIDRLRVDRTLRTLCGWQPGEKLPSESTFSRALAEVAHSHVLDQLHALRSEEYLGDEVSLFVARDSTAISAREKHDGKHREKKAARPKRKRGRPRKGEEVNTEKVERRLVRQLRQTAEEATAELPTHCGMGAKRHGCGIVTAWRGYKLHVDITENGIPVSAITTSAECHDSQVAIPLMRLSSKRITYCYELMDSGYAGQEIRQVAEELGHVAIVAKQGQKNRPAEPMEDDRARLYRSRTAVERFNSQFKDTCNTRQIWVRGQEKVHATLMFALLVVFAKQLPSLLC